MLMRQRLGKRVIGITGRVHESMAFSAVKHIHQPDFAKAKLTNAGQEIYERSSCFEKQQRITHRAECTGTWRESMKSSPTLKQIYESEAGVTKQNAHESTDNKVHTSLLY